MYFRLALREQRAGQQPGFAGDLEPVADAEHRSAALGEGEHVVHDRALKRAIAPAREIVAVARTHRGE